MGIKAEREARARSGVQAHTDSDATGGGARAKRPAKALEGLERPRMRWKVVAQIALAFVVLWVTALMAVPYVQYWGVGVAGVLTLVAAGFGLYLWRLTRKSSAIVDILKGAKDKEGRQQALAQLEASGQAGDAMNALARAQLLAQEKPAEAIAVLEAVDLKKAPVLVQDDVRANLALLYLSTNRVRDARPLVDAMRLDRQPQAQAKALYAAVMAETMARTGRAAEAKKLLQTFGGDAESQGEARALLLRAQVYTYSATKNRGLARQALGQLAEISPMMLAPFAGRGMHPDIQGLARQLLTKSGVLPQAKPRIQRL